ncbi:MAG TPA: Nramp family divalent metal transporter [Pirellulales bacterium]|nr:Nramp family divalent metal transporter [Pirellulales bacterium]
MDSNPTTSHAPAAASPPPAEQTVAAGYLPPWHLAQLPEPPNPGWRLWIGLVGPGVVLAGTSIGSGELLFGPAVTAQYGPTFLWLATISIVLQVFCNLMMMRFTLYCGEPIIAGGLRVWPGPRGWIAVYGLLDLVGGIWAYNAAGAAGPLAAALLGHLAGSGSTSLLGIAMSEAMFVRVLGIIIFALAFVPLVFGGTVYRMLEKVMTIKLILILGYLTLVTAFLVSSHNIWAVVGGFFEFGMYAERAETIIVDPHFHFTLVDNADHLLVKGTVERGTVMIAQYQVNGVTQKGKLSPEAAARRDAVVQKAVARMHPGEFFVETQPQEGSVLAIAGRVERSRWIGEEFTVKNAEGVRHYPRLEEVPEQYHARLAALLENRGLEKRSLVGYVSEHGRLPDIDWFMLAAFTAIAGAGGLSNTMFSNYTREKGWGMGRHVGAIPSAVGGRTIKLSHVGSVFPLDAVNLRRWRGWLRHITRDQVCVWMLASFVGMALPCMVSLEFIRNATVDSDRVAAMTAEGICQRYPDHRQVLWTITLLAGFLVLVPGQISVGDQISRRWTDIIWMSNPRAQSLRGNQVKYVYYTILSLYAVFGFTMLCLFPALSLAKFAAGVGNVSMGVSSLQALFANRVLLPRALRPHPLQQIGVVCCALFFFGISVVVLSNFFR